MALVSVSVDSSIETKSNSVFFFHVQLQIKTNVYRIINVISAPEYSGAFFGRLEQFLQIRYGPVVQVGTAQPDAIQGHVGVTVSLAEMTEAFLSVTGIEEALVHRQFFGVGVQPRAVCADEFDG